MKKILTAGLAALTLGGGALATAAPADAQSWHNGNHGSFHGNWGRGNRGWGPGAALTAGIIGLGLGAAIASDHSRYYYGGPGYYDDGYYPSRVCYAPRQVWDPYVGGYVVERVRYAC